MFLVGARTLLAELESIRESVRVESEKLRLLGNNAVGSAGRQLRRAAFHAAKAAQFDERAPANPRTDEIKRANDAAAAAMKAVSLAITAVPRQCGSN